MFAVSIPVEIFSDVLSGLVVECLLTFVCLHCNTPSLDFFHLCKNIFVCY